MTPETLIREAHEQLAQLGIARSNSWITRTVRAYRRQADAGQFGDFLLTQVNLNGQRRREAEKFAAGEFAHCKRRGDLMKIRSKRQHPWRTSTD